MKLAALAFLTLATAASAAPMSDAQVRQAIIQESIASYPGPCACPYEAARNGSMCGRRSAYSRPGGYAPICYDRDVPPGMVADWRAKHS
jgi:hypothetical protein